MEFAEGLYRFEEGSVDPLEVAQYWDVYGSWSHEIGHPRGAHASFQVHSKICLEDGFGSKSRSQDLSDWRKGVFVNHCAACRGGSEEERREEDAGLQILVGVGPVSLGSKGSSVSQRSSEAKNRFWAFKCYLLWPKDFPARIPQVISLLLMSPPLEPKKRDPKMLICKLRNIAGLSGSLRRVVCNCL
nr:hypothetical protein CFP56_47644 [Quercus suber]